MHIISGYSSAEITVLLNDDFINCSNPKHTILSLFFFNWDRQWKLTNPFTSGKKEARDKMTQTLKK